MKTEPLRIAGAYLMIPDVIIDDRGFFCCTSDTAAVPAARFWRYCTARSAMGVVRGLHVRPPPGEAKLVRCTSGAVFDVIVDLREGSPTALSWQSVLLDDTGQNSLYIPAGCAHGYQAVTDRADVSYHIGAEYDPEAGELAIAYDDPELGIAWPLEVTAVSPRDSAGLPLRLALRMLAGAP